MRPIYRTPSAIAGGVLLFPKGISVPIATTDIKFKYATSAGAAGNSNAGAANTSLGKYISTTEVPTATLNALFDDISGAENAALDVEYRCVFIHNSHGSLTLTAPILWVEAQFADGASVAIGLDTTAPTVIASAPVQALTVATEQDAPAGVVFSTPITKGTGLALASIPAGQCAAFWVKRTAANSDAMNGDGFTFRVEGDTGA